MIAVTSVRLQDARGEGDQARARELEATEQTRGDTELCNQADEEARVDIDGETIGSSDVQQIGTVEDGNAEASAVGEELLAIVDGAGAGLGWRAADVDTGAVESGDVQEVGAVGDGEAQGEALGEEIAAITAGRASSGGSGGARWSCGRSRSVCGSCRGGSSSWSSSRRSCSVWSGSTITVGGGGGGLAAG